MSKKVLESPLKVFKTLLCPSTVRGGSVPSLRAGAGPRGGGGEAGEMGRVFLCLYSMTPSLPSQFEGESPNNSPDQLGLIFKEKHQL